MGNKLITQSILIITSITIVMTYIRPSFGEIAEIQTDMARYESTLSKANELNAALQNLIATEKNIPQRDHDRLRTYLPQSINNVSVMRDVQNIFRVLDVTLVNLTSASTDVNSGSFSDDYDDEDQRPSSASAPQLVFRDFDVAFAGTYDELKQVLQAIESNAYPLEIVSLAFQSPLNPDEQERAQGLPADVFQYTMKLRTYALPAS